MINLGNCPGAGVFKRHESGIANLFGIDLFPGFLFGLIVTYLYLRDRLSLDKNLDYAGRKMLRLSWQCEFLTRLQ